MSKSSDTLLIAGGCSWTDPYGSPYYIPENIKVWPSIVADVMDWDIFNAAKGGASNDYIFSSTMEEIYKKFLLSKKYKNLVVMIAWTESRRINFYNSRYSGGPKYSLVKNPNPSILTTTHVDQVYYDYLIGESMRNYFRDKISLSGDEAEKIWGLLYRDISNNTYRQIYIIDDFCKRNNIKIIHHKALWTEWNNPEILGYNNGRYGEELRKIENQMINDNFGMEGVYWKDQCLNITNVAGGKNLPNILPCINKLRKRFEDPLFECGHPKQHGMDFIANEMIAAYDENYPENEKIENPDYIYD